LQELWKEEEAAEHDDDAKPVCRERRAESGRPKQPKIDQRIGEPTLSMYERNPDGEADHDGGGR
jgi:hypothetical protein